MQIQAYEPVLLPENYVRCRVAVQRTFTQRRTFCGAVVLWKSRKVPPRPSLTKYTLPHETLLPARNITHHHHHHISVMELGHLLTRSGLTYPEVSSKVCHDSFCQLRNSVSLPWVIYYEAFYLHVVSSFSLFLSLSLSFFFFYTTCSITG